MPSRSRIIASWVTHTTVAQLVTSYAAFVAYALYGPVPDWIPTIAAVITAVLVGTIWGTLQVFLTALFDVAMLALARRSLPTGLSGIALSVLTPVPALAAYAVYPPTKWVKFGPWGALALLLVPMIVGLVAARGVLGAAILRRNETKS